MIQALQVWAPILFVLGALGIGYGLISAVKADAGMPDALWVIFVLMFLLGLGLLIWT